MFMSGFSSYLEESFSARISQNSKISGPVPSMYFKWKQYKQTFFPLTQFLFLSSSTQLFCILYEYKHEEFYLMKVLPTGILKFIFRISCVQNTS